MGTIRIPESTKWIQLGNDFILMSKTSGKCYRTNEAGRFIWMAITEAAQPAEIAVRMRERFAISLDQAVLDISTFTSKMASIGLIEGHDRVVNV